ncbi:MAG: hypothetical protein E7632_13025 [Ruminococcaceae bacterium]|nr:hypothetical protein [Oscillospiraceae bacterium]
MEKIKYFIINKESDFERGLYEKMEPCPDGLRFRSESESGVGMFLSRIFDSGERGTTWHRLLLTTADCRNSDLRVTVYASDTQECSRSGETTTLRQVFEDDSLTLREKLRLFEPFAVKRSAEASDILLHDVQGRYIWFLAEIYSRSDRPVLLREARLLLPAQSWIDRLPQIYRNSDGEGHFLERYLAIFQTLYEELDAAIADSARFFDPDSADGEFLTWLAEWLDISEAWLWEEEKLRRFILRAVSLYRRRGTREALEEIVELYTGEKPYIVEEFTLEKYEGTDFYEKTLLPMYGSDPYTVTVLIRSDIVNSEHAYNALRRIMEEMLPVSLNLHVVLLEPYIFAGKFSYLGINSTLGSYKPAAFDGRSPMMLTTLGGRSEQDRLS